MTEFNSKETLLLNSLMEFYKLKSNLDIFLPIIQQNSNISLRILDWLVTNYSKKNNTYYEVYKGGTKNIFCIYLSYKNQLKAYSKKYFDPFCRRNRIDIELNTINKDFSNKITTTIGQLNFFRWFIENKLLNYVVLNIAKIDEDMNITIDKTLKRDKRQELSKNKIKNFNMISNTFVVSFD